ncbi:DUF1801 domain-containing protein [Hyphobacterium sp. CCMP332]|nr:DUF1801 domain-containing protein [Hyphobacterium sp. CCMP332]
MALLKIKNIIMRCAPLASESINYNIPAYTLMKKGNRNHQIMIAGYKKHIGFYPHPDVIAHFESELNKYEKGKGSVQFPLTEALPEDLIEKMIRYKMQIIRQ